MEKTGNIIVPAPYEEAVSFKDGVAVVKENGIWAILEIISVPNVR